MLQAVDEGWHPYLGLLSLGVEDAELELGADFRLVALHEEEVETQVVLGLLIQPLRIDPQAPLELVVASR